LRILGIDPGSRVCGYGVVDLERGEARFVAAGTLRALQGRTPVRLSSLFRGLTALFAEHRPDGVAVETPFVGPSVSAALRIGEARGVVLLAAAEASVPVHEYAPAEVKRAVVGHGTASKPQVARLVQAWLRLSEPPESTDAADALALALCHARAAQSAAALASREVLA
jgi:crossover junction endodeoxyribonuclease RuvC